MKTFYRYINESNYIRFLKKNKNLDSRHINIINKFFQSDKKAVRDFERDHGGIQNKNVLNMRWSDYEEFMKKYPSYRRRNLKSIKVPGIKGKDYWPIKLKNKNFIANVPLTWDTAQFMNSCKYGTLNVDYCIGYEDIKGYWNEHVISDEKVPVYIVDGNNHKWVVMILHDNKRYEVWDKANKEDKAILNKEPIPNFSIKKELIQGKSKLYDELREIILKDRIYTEDDLINAINDHERMVEYMKDDTKQITDNLYYNDERINNVLIKIMHELKDIIDEYKYEIKYEFSGEMTPEELKYRLKAFQEFYEMLDNSYINTDEELEEIYDNIRKKYPDIEFPYEEPEDEEKIELVYFTEPDDFKDYYNVLKDQGVYNNKREFEIFFKCAQQHLINIILESYYEQLHITDVEYRNILINECGIEDPTYLDELYPHLQ